MHLRGSLTFCAAVAYRANNNATHNPILQRVPKGCYLSFKLLWIARAHRTKEYNNFLKVSVYGTKVINLEFKVLAEEGNARTGVLRVNNKSMETPNFIYAATYAQVNLIDPKQFKELGVHAVMVNTFQIATKLPHLLEQGNFAERMGLQNSEITMSDSGGFQVMSYGDTREDGTGKVAFYRAQARRKREERRAYVDNDGVLFSLRERGKLPAFFRLTPESSMELQQQLQTDIIFAFDQCHTKRDYQETKDIMERTHQWEQRSREFHNAKQAIYGIVHGGQFRDLRLKSAARVNSLGFDGLSIGGYLGQSHEEMLQVMGWTMPALDRAKPVHLLGIGRIRDLFDSVALGIDTFDCVETTRLGRRGLAFVSQKKANHNLEYVLHLKTTEHKDDEQPIDQRCALSGCPVCTTTTRAQLIQLKAHVDDPDQREANHLKYMSLVTAHNIYFISSLMREMRAAISEGNFHEFYEQWMGRKQLPS